MWQFFQWAWNLSWGDGIALMICLFVFWYGKKWIDQKFGTDSFSKRQKRELKQIVKEAIEETKRVTCNSKNIVCFERPTMLFFMISL